MTDTPAKPDAKAAVPVVKPPRMIDFACLALLLQCVAWIAVAVALRFNTSAYMDILFDTARKSDKKKSHYLASNPDDVKELMKQLSDTRHGAALQAGVVVLALLMLTFMLRRTRGASAARWSIVLVSVLMNTPFAVFRVGGGLPAIHAASNVLLGVSSLAAIVLLFVPQSRAYFAQIREALGRGGPAGGRGGLFAPRQRDKTSLSKTTTSRSSVLTSSAATRAQSRIAKSAQDKHRAEAAAVAKGAQVARNRAKAAAKSRRMED